MAYGLFNGLNDSTVYGGSRPLKSSIYRHCGRSGGNPRAGGASAAVGVAFSRHASFVSHSRNSDNLDSDQEVLTGGGGTPVPFSSYLSYGHSGQSYAASSAGSHRSSGASVQLCRCGSGGPLLPSASNSPPAHPPLPPPPSNPLPTSAYSRLVQSLPSTPNASRRPVSPMRPSLCHHLPQQHLLDSVQSQVGAHLKHQHLGQHQPAQLYGSVGASGPECVVLGAPGSGTSAAPLIPPNDSTSFHVENSRVAGAETTSAGTAHKGLRAIQQWTRSQRQRSNSRNRPGLLNSRSCHSRAGGVQPLMKLSTLVIVLLAFLIIGFIVLSPLFHYLM